MVVQGAAQAGGARRHFAAWRTVARGHGVAWPKLKICGDGVEHELHRLKQGGEREGGELWGHAVGAPMFGEAGRAEAAHPECD